MRNRLKIAFGLAVLAALAGCQESKPVPKAETGAPVDTAVAELERFQAEENARSRVTMIDAATGDAAAMPEDSSAPIQIDLARTDGAKETKSPASSEPTPDAAAVAPPGPVASPPPEEFPSVAQPTAG